MKRLALLGLLLIVTAGIAYHLHRSKAPIEQRASKVLILKKEHKLLLLDAENNPIRSYSIAIGRGGLDRKQVQGDHKTPEGLYVVDRHKRDSRFHRALHVSYPDNADRERAQQLGAEPGGDIMIHGIQNGLGWLGPLHRVVDWTDGCIAVTDSEIEEIWSGFPRPEGPGFHRSRPLAAGSLRFIAHL